MKPPCNPHHKCPVDWFRLLKEVISLDENEYAYNDEGSGIDQGCEDSDSMIAIRLFYGCRFLGNPDRVGGKTNPASTDPSRRTRLADEYSLQKSQLRSEKGSLRVLALESEPVDPRL